MLERESIVEKIKKGFKFTATNEYMMTLCKVYLANINCWGIGMWVCLDVAKWKYFRTLSG